MDSNPSPAPSPGWTRPNDVMKMRKLKAKRRALQARMSTSIPLQIFAPKRSTNNGSICQGIKRRNPFKCSPNKVSKLDVDADLEVSGDTTLFQFLNPTGNIPTTTTRPAYSFSNILKNDSNNTFSTATDAVAPSELWCDHLPVDWSLKTKLRFQSPKPLPWKHTFKASEEASGTTGFVRCLNTGPSNDIETQTLDTSSNAKFYQCCLVWQHPSLPWLNTFPRDSVKALSQTGVFGTDQKLAACLLGEWSESLRSLHQLLRVRQCPYFYVCGPSFTCLFRAAGLAGIQQAHAIITPTTRGFRDSLKKEGLEFTMPFCNMKCSGEDEKENEDDEEGGNHPQLGEEATSFLENLGVETSQFPHLNPDRARIENKKFRGIDSSPLSLVYLEDMELMGLINFLLNSNSCVASTGTLAGVPPTLLSPVAFQAATLKPVKVKGGLVRLEDGGSNYSMEVTGPILPHTIHQLTLLLGASLDNYSVTGYPIVSTLPFCKLKPPTDKAAVPQAFAKEGLIDCGFGSTLIARICSPPNEEEEIKSNRMLPNIYREIKYKDGKYTWTDK